MSKEKQSNKEKNTKIQKEHKEKRKDKKWKERKRRMPKRCKTNIRLNHLIIIENCALLAIFLFSQLENERPLLFAAPRDTKSNTYVLTKAKQVRAHFFHP